jgi:hypothetical protein
VLSTDVNPVEHQTYDEYYSHLIGIGNKGLARELLAQYPKVRTRTCQNTGFQFEEFRSFDRDLFFGIEVALEMALMTLVVASPLERCSTSVMCAPPDTYGRLGRLPYLITSVFTRIL